MKFAFSFFLLTLSASAGTIHETIYFPGELTPEWIERWNESKQKRSYVFHFDYASSWEILPILEIENADTIRVNAELYPRPENLEAWKKLADHGVHFVGFGIGVPSALEVERINEIGFQKTIFVLTKFPTVEEAERLTRLTSPYSLTFDGGRYPTFINREAFRALPGDIPLLFATEYWPWYSHMDLMNMIPQKIRIRVRGSFPNSQRGLEYLHNIQNLESIGVTTDYEVPTSEWKKFRKIPLHWTSTNWVPTLEALEGFAEGAKEGLGRQFVLQFDQELTAQERERLEQAPFPIEWNRKITSGNE